jgi:hypothetical protein
MSWFVQCDLEKVVRERESSKGGTNVNKTLQYAEDMDLVARNSRKLQETFQQLEKASEKVGLNLSEIKTKCMINTSKK